MNAHAMPEQRVAIVSGGTRGIGRAITERLLADGWCVLATYVADAASADLLAAEHPNLRVVRSDARYPAACAAVVQECLAQFGQLDHVVASAAISRDAPLRDLADDDWEAVLATNLSGPFRLVRAAIAALDASPRGRVVVVSTVAASMGNAGQGAYAASKAGLVGLTRTMAREFARAGTTVNLVVPGPTADSGMTADADPAFVEAISRKIPLHRLGRPEEVAHAVRFLLDDLSGFITGTAVVVDGGLSM